MPEVLIGLFAVAALVLAIAGAVKLRSPDGAAEAAFTLGLPAGRPLIRAFAAGELALALWCLVAPAAPVALILAVTYAGFAGMAFLLARRRSSCGCFGGGEAPAGPAHWLLSAALALVGAAAVRWTPHGLLWVYAHHPAASAALTLGVGGAAYAVVVIYTQLPLAWSAWSGQ